MLGNQPLTGSARPAILDLFVIVLRTTPEAPITGVVTIRGTTKNGYTLHATPVDGIKTNRVMLVGHNRDEVLAQLQPGATESCPLGDYREAIPALDFIMDTGISVLIPKSLQVA